MSALLHALQCPCGFRVEGEAIFVTELYKTHQEVSHPLVAAGESHAPIRRAITSLSVPGSALRHRLEAAASDLIAGGYNPAEVAARLEAGEPVP